MPDVLIRDVPADDLARIDEQARRAGLNRTEYLRRRLHTEAARSTSPVTSGDLTAFASLVQDLADTDVMRQAWS